ncbi:hypothetical protein ARMGADRAFT_1040075 [Armillaria gallica]|uniref:Uncharacterized protein n=1 Tax=Armillaria gallica TaxID=47427 RepID=A0A2H3CPV3_ARMGA|nr:hypothetical protein ARMGADRAFT_1040075 [Armillaria gallica]
MFFLFFQLLDNTPIGFHNTSVSLRWAQSDPSDFVLGAFLIHTKEAVMVAKTMKPVENFTENRTTHMTFNYTSLPGNRDCILLAWLPDSNAGQHFAQSQVFSVTDPEATTSSTLISSGISTTSSVSGTVPPGLGTTPTSPIVVNSTPSPKLTTPKSTIPSSPTSSVSEMAFSASLNHASHTGIIVGIVFGVLALGCVVSTSIYVLILRRRSKAAAPLLLPQDSPVPSLSTPFPLNPSGMRVHQERETEAQESMSEVPRGRLEAEIARLREEIMALRLENQIRHMEAGYSSLSPPSYRRTSVTFIPLVSSLHITLDDKPLAFQSTSISLNWELCCDGCDFRTDEYIMQNVELQVSGSYHSINMIPFPGSGAEEHPSCCAKDLSGMVFPDVPMGNTEY